MTIVTLLTDFGYRDGYPGVMKGVIWKIAPQTHIADLSHDITPQDIIEATLLLSRLAPYFPDGTIHVVVVDPGVGTSRRAIAAQIGSQFFIGPDNGVFSFLLERAQENHLSTTIIHLNKPEFWLPEVSNTFHGRDIFAPVAAHLAAGVALNALGSPVTDPIMLNIPKPIQTHNGWQGQVIHIDHFGNLATNIYAHLLRQSVNMVIKIAGEEIHGLATTYGERPLGSLIALLDSNGSLAISVVNGNAADTLHAKVGDRVNVFIVE